MATLSSESVHASAVSSGDHAILIMGASGSGKSDLALRLVDRGAGLISDDYCLVFRKGQDLFASAPERLTGKIELRGVGICEIEAAPPAPIRLLVRLTQEYERFPMDQQQESLVGVTLPLLRINALEASAPIKVEWALKRAVALLASPTKVPPAKGVASL